jgi:hypothetical protein
MASSKPQKGAVVELVSSAELVSAWTWLKAVVTKRPAVVHGECIYDPKLWHVGATAGPLEVDAQVCDSIARLYLASTLCAIADLNRMANGANAPTVTSSVPLDDQIAAVVSKPERLRASLAEHLAFWIRMADAATANAGPFALAQPNLLPEDKGHDGLLMIGGTSPSLEIQSVKNSKNDPKALVSSAAFRKTGAPKKKRQLDDFWLLTHRSVGMVRLHRMVSQVADSLGLATNEKLRDSVIADAAYNAVVVANHKHAKPDMFEGYKHVVSDVQRRIGTYVGAKAWVGFGGAVQKSVKKILKARGVI